MACHPSEIIGNWRGDTPAERPYRISFNVQFLFEADGGYTYSAGQGSFQWTSHEGTFDIHRSRDMTGHWPCEITLTPNPDTIVGRAVITSKHMPSPRYYVRRPH